MPSIQIHLAIANRYIEKHKVEDKEKFLQGSIAPDFKFPKDESHYTKKSNTNQLIEHLKNKVDIDRFLKENVIKNDYDKGVLLHLLTDKIFFTEFFDKEYIKSVSYEEFTINLYTSYNHINTYIENKYNIVYTEELVEKLKKNIEQSRKEKNMKDDVEGIDIIPLEKLDDFIERMSDIDLNKYINNNT